MPGVCGAPPARTCGHAHESPAGFPRTVCSPCFLFISVLGSRFPLDKPHCLLLTLKTAHWIFVLCWLLHGSSGCWVFLSFLWARVSALAGAAWAPPSPCLHRCFRVPLAVLPAALSPVVSAGTRPPHPVSGSISPEWLASQFLLPSPAALSTGGLWV